MNHVPGTTGTGTRRDGRLAARPTRRTARRDLSIFFALVVGLSAPLELAIARTQALQDAGGVVLVGPLMLVPASSAFLTRLLTRQPPWRTPTLRTAEGGRGPLGDPIVYAIPLLVCLPAYALAVALGLVRGDPGPLGPWAGAVVAATILNLVLVPGEELGWRGFMVPRLIEAEVPAPLIVSALIWGVWHLPLILWGSLVLDGPAPWLSAAIFMVLAVTLGYVLAWQRVQTGRTIGPILLHVIWNVVFQAGFEVAVAGDHEGLWLGEAGLLTTATLVILVGWLARPGGRLAAHETTEPFPGRGPAPRCSPAAQPSPAGDPTEEAP